MSTLLHQSINDAVSTSVSTPVPTNDRTVVQDRPNRDRPDTLTITADESTFVAGAHNRVCPRCNSSIDRVRRRSIDRFMSMFCLVHRYRCVRFVCKWEGNLPVQIVKTTQR